MHLRSHYLVSLHSTITILLYQVQLWPTKIQLILKILCVVWHAAIYNFVVTFTDEDPSAVQPYLELAWSFGSDANAPISDTPQV